MDEFTTSSRSNTCLREVLLELCILILKLINPLAKLNDRLDPREVHTLLLGKVLNLAQALDVALRIAATATGGTHRTNQPHPVIRAQGLGVHAGELSGNGDDKVLA